MSVSDTLISPAASRPLEKPESRRPSTVVLDLPRDCRDTEATLRLKYQLGFWTSMR